MQRSIPFKVSKTLFNNFFYCHAHLGFLLDWLILGIIFGVSAMTPLWMGQRRAAKHANTQANKAHSEAQRLAAPPPAASSKKPTSDLNDELGI